MVQPPLPTAVEAAAIYESRKFIERFPLEMMPFCAFGMELLHDLARTNPALDDWGRDQPVATMDNPDFKPTPL